MADRDPTFDDRYAYGASRWRPRAGSPPTRRNLEVFAATLLLGRKEAAWALGLCENTVRLHIGDLFTRLQVSSRYEAAAALSWLSIPADLIPSGVGAVPVPVSCSDGDDHRSAGRRPPSGGGSSDAPARLAGASRPGNHGRVAAEADHEEPPEAPTRPVVLPSGERPPTSERSAGARWDAAMQLTRIAPHDDQWLAWIGSQPDATLLHHPAWASVVTDTYGFGSFVMVAPDAQGQIAAGIPIAEVGRGRRRRWVALPFTDHCPPLLAPGLPAADFTLALEAARAEAGARQVEVRAEVEGARQPDPDAVIHTLALDPDTQAMLRRFHPSQVQRNLKRAAKGAVRVRRSTDASDLLEGFFDLHLRTRRRLGVPTQPRRFFELIAQHVLSPGLGYVLLAELDGRPIAAALFLAWNRTVIYKFGASDPEGWTHRPNHLIFWEAIRSAAEDGFSVFDFGRSDLEATGLRDFKSSWDATERPLRYSYLGEPPGARTKRAARLLEPIIRHAPLWVGRRIGERLYRFAA